MALVRMKARHTLMFPRYFTTTESDWSKLIENNGKKKVKWWSGPTSTGGKTSQHMRWWHREVSIWSWHSYIHNIIDMNTTLNGSWNIEQNAASIQESCVMGACYVPQNIWHHLYSYKIKQYTMQTLYHYTVHTIGTHWHTIGHTIGPTSTTMFHAWYTVVSCMILCNMPHTQWRYT